MSHTAGDAQRRHPLHLIVFGPPGSGKGTQSERLAKRQGLHHISTGELLRDHIARRTEHGLLADSYISQGHLVPDELAIRILEDELDRPEAANGVIFDGFPRTIPQAEALLKMLERRGVGLDNVIGLEVDDDELRQRLLRRGIDSGRSDDNAAAIDERLKVYHSTTSPLIEFFANRGYYRPVKGTGSIDEIADAIDKALD